MTKILALIGAGIVIAIAGATTGIAANGNANAAAVCPAAVSAAHCHALVVTDERGNPQASSGPTGLSPAAIKSVYGFPTDDAAGAGKTIAIVDAYDDPTAESDLAAFSA